MSERGSAGENVIGLRASPSLYPQHFLAIRLLAFRPPITLKPYPIPHSKARIPCLSKPFRYSGEMENKDNSLPTNVAGYLLLGFATLFFLAAIMSGDSHPGGAALLIVLSLILGFLGAKSLD